MAIQRIKPQNEYAIEITPEGPEKVTIALAVTKEFRRTEVRVSFIQGHGGRDVTLDNHRRYSVEDIPNGTSSVVIRNSGPEIIDVSWA
jgi:hypothetical protein